MRYFSRVALYMLAALCKSDGAATAAQNSSARVQKQVHTRFEMWRLTKNWPAGPRHTHRRRRSHAARSTLAPRTTLKTYIPRNHNP